MVKPSWAVDAPDFTQEENINNAVKKYLVAHGEKEMGSVNDALNALPLEAKNIKTFNDAMDSVYETMRDIMISKQKLRGSGNIDKQGLVGVVSRMKDDKLERIMKSVKSEATRAMLIDDGMPLEIVDKYYPSIEVSEDHAEDSLEDDLLDVANYAIICVMVLRGLWGKPVIAE